MAAPIEFKWNTFTHDYPSTNAVLTGWKKNKKKSKLSDGKSSKTELMKMFNEASMFLEPVFKIYLSTESYTLQRLLYKFKNQQKHWKWFNLLKKIEKCLRRANDINLHELFKKMSSFCEMKKDFGDMEQVPSDTSIKFLLEKTVGLSKLCSCIIELSEYTFTLIVGNLQIGEFLVQNLTFVAIISRIWVLVRGILIKLFSWYEMLRNFSVQDQESKYYTMFKELPDCLSKWVELDIASLKVRNKKIKKSKQDTLDKMFGSLQKSSDSLGNLMGQEPSNMEDLYNAMEACSEMDLGEPIVNADNDNAIPKKKKKKKKPLLCEDADGDNNKDELDDGTFAPVQEGIKDFHCNEVMSMEDTGVAIRRKKKKKRKRIIDDSCNDDVIGDQLGDTTHLHERLNVPCMEHEASPIKVFGNEESLTLIENTTEDKVDNVVKKKKKKRKKNANCNSDKTHLIGENSELAQVHPEDKGHSLNLKEVGRKIKKNATLVGTDLVTQRECISTVDPMMKTNNLSTDATKKIKKKKKKCLPHVVDEKEMALELERKCKKRKHENTDEIAMAMNDAPRIKTKRRKVPDSQSRVIFQSDEDELDDIFARLQ